MSVLVLETRASAELQSISSGVTSLLLLGFADVGDTEPMTFIKLGSAPSPSQLWQFQSADSAWWSLETQVVTPKMMGAAGDGTTNDTAAVQAAFDYGSGQVCFSACNGGYLCDTITVFSNFRIFGPGQVRQRVEGNNLFDVPGCGNVIFEGLNIRGALTQGSGIPSAASNNNAISIRQSSFGIHVVSCTISRFRYEAVYAEDAVDITIVNNLVYECAYGIRLRGVGRAEVCGNIVRDTCLYSSEPTESQFAIAIGLDSTDGHEFGVCKDVVIADNNICNYPYAQGILVHAGVRIIISGNCLQNVSVGISANPFNSTDALNYVSITGNRADGTLAESLPGGSQDAGITVQAGPASGGGSTPDIYDVSIAGNVLHAFNRIAKDGGQGGIVLGWTNNVAVTGNVIEGCGCNGIMLTATGSPAASTVVAVTLVGNVIANVVLYGGVQNYVGGIASASTVNANNAQN